MRARDIVLSSDAAVLLGMLAGWFILAVLLVIVLLFDPPFLAVPGWLVLALAVENRAARAPRAVEARVSPPIGPAA